MLDDNELLESGKPKKDRSKKKKILRKYAATGQDAKWRAKEEPKLSSLSGFDDCENCYFRISTLKRIAQDIAKLRGEA